ncbi:MAG: glycosyltransferase [Fimbriimonadaceae bacterium]
MIPRFSVIIPCYNQAHFLSEALDSVLAQSLDPQVIVVDDGSTDCTSEVAESYGRRIVLVRQANSGLPAARNAGILQADGDYLVFLDSDDALRPDYLSRAATLLSREPEIDVLHVRADVVDMGGRIVASFGGADLGTDPFGRLLEGNDGPPNTWIVRRSLLARTGLFDPSLRSCEDWDLWLRCALVGARFQTDETIVAVYRDVPGSMSKQIETMWRSFRTVLFRYANSRNSREDRLKAARAVRRRARGYRAVLWRHWRQGQRTEVLRILRRNPSMLVHILLTVGAR